MALNRAREGVMPPIREMLAESGITEQQWRVLRVLAEHGPQNISTLADQACFLFPSLTRITQSMSKKGLITLSRDSEDKRRQTVAITKKGQKIIDDNMDQAVQIVKNFKKKLGTKQYELLLDLLAVLDPGTDE